MRPTIDSGSVVSMDAYLHLVGVTHSEPLPAELDATLSSAGVPPRFLHASHPLADEVAGALLEGGNVWVWGPVGTRKTTLACAALRIVARSGRRVRFVPMRAYLDAARAAMRGGEDPLPRLARVPVLVLDDLGKEAATGFCLERVFALADERSGRMLPTLVTTQYRPGALIDRLAREGDRDTATAVVSRLRQDCLLLEAKGTDGRLA